MVKERRRNLEMDLMSNCQRAMSGSSRAWLFHHEPSRPKIPRSAQHHRQDAFAVTM